MNLEINACVDHGGDVDAFPGVACGTEHLPDTVSEDDIFYTVYERHEDGTVTALADFKWLSHAKHWVDTSHPGAILSVI